jgi:hypothetical protein
MEKKSPSPGVSVLIIVAKNEPEKKENRVLLSCIID